MEHKKIIPFVSVWYREHRQQHLRRHRQIFLTALSSSLAGTAVAAAAVRMACFHYAESMKISPI